jgi:hypothetical protein
VTRARYAASGLSAAALIALAGSARADDESGVLDPRHHQAVSPQNFVIETRIALYQPQVDSDPSLKGQTPYASTFGTSPRFEVAMEFDWQALHIPGVGTLGPGIAAGYTNMSGIAQRTDKIVSPPSQESTTLEILPLYAVAVFRLDLLQHQLHVPFVPYAKAGLGYALWRASNTAGTSSYNGVVGEGHTIGTQVAFGGALNIGIFDPNSARQLDESTGINNTYLFAEYMMSDLNGLGQSHALLVGTNSLAFGLAFEF